MVSPAFVSTFVPAGLTRSSFAPSLSPSRAPEPSAPTVVTASAEPRKGGLRKLVAGALAAALFAAPLVPPPALHLAPPAEAARGGGRVGGSSFRSMPRSAPRSSGGYRGGGYRGGNRGGYGGGYGGGMLGPVIVNPFMMPVPVYAGGGGGVGALATLAFVGIAVSTLSRIGGAVFSDTDDDIYGGGAPPGAVVSLKLGLLASARGVQVDLDRIARSADTTTAGGLAAVLQETVVALLRHPDYWTHAAVAARRETSPEPAFNAVAASERSKIRRETLSNVRGAVREMADGAGDDIPQEFIVVTLLVVADPQLVRRLPRSINNEADVRRALQGLAFVQADDIQALELLWAPQRAADVLTKQEMLEDHPELRAV